MDLELIHYFLGQDKEKRFFLFVFFNMFYHSSTSQVISVFDVWLMDAWPELNVPMTQGQKMLLCSASVKSYENLFAH